MLYEAVIYDLEGNISWMIDFEYNRCFIGPLAATDNPFLSPDEAHLVYMVDQDLRMEGNFDPTYNFIIEVKD